MPAQKYVDPILKKYADLIAANTNVFKAVYYGEPTRIPASLFPCLILSKRETRVGNLSNAEDEHGIAITMTVIYDIRKELSTAEDDAKIVEGVAGLYDLVEGREADYTLKATSVLDILRSNVELDTANNLRTDLSTITRVDYGQTLRDRAPEQWSLEASIDFIAHFAQVR